MMDLQINLLSPQKKAKLKALVIFLFVKENLELVLLTVTVLGITHLAGWLFLARVTADLAGSTTLVNRDVALYNQHLRDLNQVIHAVREASRNFIPLSPKLVELVGVMPGTIKIVSLELDRERSRLFLSGLAENRAALLALQARLSTLPWIKSVTFPSSQLFQQQNISFELTATLQGLAWRTDTMTEGGRASAPAEQ